MFSVIPSQQTNLIVRNYFKALILVMLLCVVLGDLYDRSATFSQPNRLDSYNRFISAHIVTQTQKSLYR